MNEENSLTQEGELMDPSLSSDAERGYFHGGKAPTKERNTSLAVCWVFISSGIEGFFPSDKELLCKMKLPLSGQN